jgi:hypothetical protein
MIVIFNANELSYIYIIKIDKNTFYNLKIITLNKYIIYII